MFKKLEIYFQYDVSGSYSIKTKRKRLKMEEYEIKLRRFLAQIVVNRTTSLSNFFVRCRLPGKFLRHDYFLVLDCDSERAKNLAIEELVYRKIEFLIVESSPDHFWIVCDYISKNKKNLKKIAMTIPGCDENYFKVIENIGCVLRAYPKGPNRPIIHFSEEFKNERIIEWLEAFQRFWKMEVMDHFVEQAFIHLI